MLHFILYAIHCVIICHSRPKPRSWTRFTERAASAAKILVCNKDYCKIRIMLLPLYCCVTDTYYYCVVYTYDFALFSCVTLFWSASLSYFLLALYFAVPCY